MDTKSVKNILCSVEPIFLEDFRVDVTLLAHLGSNGCLVSWQIEEVTAENIPRNRVSKLFSFLGQSQNSIHVLIRYFEEVQTPQTHLLELLKKKRDEVLSPSDQPGSSSSILTGTAMNTPTLPSFKLNDKHINALVNMILESMTALENWGGPVLHSLVIQPGQRLRIQSFLKDSKYDEAVRTTLNQYIGVTDPSPTMNDLLRIFTENRLTKLNGSVQL